MTKDLISFPSQAMVLTGEEFPIVAAEVRHHRSPLIPGWRLLEMLLRCDAEGMQHVLPPPGERFDPITARWFTPGGPLHDPGRDEVDPDGTEPVRLIAPVPPELADGDDQASRAGRESIGLDAARRFRWATLVVLGVAVAALVVAGIVAGAG